MNDEFRFVIESDRESVEGKLFEGAKEVRVERRGPPPSMHEQGLGGAHVLEPVSLSVVVTSLSVLAYRIVEHWLRRAEHGVQIDARTTPATISTIAGVPNGFVVVIGADGVPQNYNAAALNATTLTELLGGIVKGMGKSS